MISLKYILPDVYKNRRSRRIVLNIQITVLGWLVEIFGCLTIAVGVYVIGHGNGMVTLVLQICTMVLYGVLLPCSILINSSEVKDFIVESKFYMRLIKWFGCQPIMYSTQEDEEDEVYNQKSHEDERNNQDRKEEDNYQENSEKEGNKNDGYPGNKRNTKETGIRTKNT